jgi:hypothetical protein
MSIIFRNEPRKDIALGLVRSVLSGAVKLIGHILFPPMTVQEKAGTFTAAQRITGTATTNRSAGTAISGTHNVQKSVTYSCDKHEHRAYVDDDDIKEFGGEDPAIASTAQVAGFAVAAKTEAAAAAKIINATNYATALAININAPFAAITTAAIAVKRYGTPVLACSEYWLNELVSSPLVAAALLKLYGDKIIQDVQSGIPAAMKALGSLFGVETVIVGDNDWWKVSGYEDAAAVVAIRDLAGMGMNARAAIKAMPCFGVQPTFIPYEDSSLEKPFEVDTCYDPTTKANAVDVTVRAVPAVINAGGCKLVKLPAAGLVTCTTPLSNVPTGTYATTQSVTLTTATSGATIYYTTDGSTPDHTDTAFTSAISVAATATIKAIAVKDGLNDSAVMSVTITIDAG